jgi:hypothetical protein
MEKYVRNIAIQEALLHERKKTRKRFTFQTSAAWRDSNLVDFFIGGDHTYLAEHKNYIYKNSSHTIKCTGTTKNTKISS